MGVRNSRYYYRRYLEEAIGHIETAHDRLSAAFRMLEDPRYQSHMVYLQQIDQSLYHIRESLLDYLRQV